VGNLIAFRVGPESARILARELEPEFSEADLMNLPRYHIYLRMMVNGVASFGFMPHYEASQKGILDSRDIIYFLSVIAFMLFGTHVVLKNRKSA